MVPLRSLVLCTIDCEEGDQGSVIACEGESTAYTFRLSDEQVALTPPSFPS
jgi:hypothetical protein